MKRIRVVAICLALASCAKVSAEDDLLPRSRDLAKQFGSRLQSALQLALANGGPVAAVGVCKDTAPQIASELSRASGAKVRRTSLRYRNPANAPEAWEAEWLKSMESQPTAGGLVSSNEYLSKQADGSARYLLAIRTGPLCLTCHGSVPAGELKRAIDSDYPHDLARGYALNDVRGAFSITWYPRAEPAR